MRLCCSKHVSVCCLCFNFRSVYQCSSMLSYAHIPVHQEQWLHIVWSALHTPPAERLLGRRIEWQESQLVSETMGSHCAASCVPALSAVIQDEQQQCCQCGDCLTACTHSKHISTAQHSMTTTPSSVFQAPPCATAHKTGPKQRNSKAGSLAALPGTLMQ